eukprot:UN12678
MNHRTYEIILYMGLIKIFPHTFDLIIMT